jgi:hypothetical protein
MPQPARQVIEMAKRGQPFNIAVPRACNEKQRWLNVLDLAVCARLLSARRSPIQIFDDTKHAIAAKRGRSKRGQPLIIDVRCSVDVLASDSVRRVPH